MARAERKTAVKTRPPFVARLILALTSGGAYHTSVLGDLEEGFARRQVVSPKGANRWYAQQAILSMPYLLWIRIAELSDKTAAKMIVIGALTYGAIMVWNELLGEQAGLRLASILSAGDTIATFFDRIAEQIGVAIVGLTLAYVAFEKSDTLKKNLTGRLSIIYCVLVFFAVAKRAFIEIEGSYFLQAMWVVLAAFTLTVGASAGYHLRSRTDQPWPW